MAAHDDKISNNRRRLFKALSAAPVVATLRPGEALANNSAFQCAAKVRELEIVRFVAQGNLPPNCPAGDGGVGNICTIDGVIYRKVLYWPKQQLKTIGKYDTLSDDCKTVWGNLPDVIVELNGQLIELVYTADGVVTPVESNIVKNGTPVGGRFKLDVSDPEVPGSLCFSLVSLEGLVSYVGHTENMDMNWIGDGFFPQFRPQNNTSQPGTFQGMTESCMHSFMGKLFGMNGG